MGISVWQLLIILAIVLVLFGAKRLRNLGGDLGTAVKGFKNAVKEGDEEVNKEQLEDQAGEDRTIEGESTREKDKV
ncbi:Sec-independent protein translocase protein TatA [Thiohalobacter sp. COW1]|uniref:Sec-independent protein translocase protein TatA n=1 Tax=Thiohalobacter thiocyanaticus TaxID=585455 RepID=A0A1Z4VMP8_9GAMM|nr:MULTISPECIES: Sec-independent protein translocase subunit TatA [Thiohalobacter]BAZ92783.1 twin arginine-targeting protein translocase [Thiohalobacter thiocyanaticus]BCO32258.1 Sec-independent protein translocase protein TatA [Thiohalobacter sp. COW1]